MDTRNKYIVFDLDDTLYWEIDFLKSAFQEIASHVSPEEGIYEKMLALYEAKENAFEFLESVYHFPKEKSLEIYRNHFPRIVLNDGALVLLNLCEKHNYKMGLLTDGRSITQRNKIKALNIEPYFAKIIISEEFGSTKPSLANYEIFLEDERQGDSQFYYIADNPSKDFVSANQLGWNTICLIGNEKNIHPQSFDFNTVFLPKYKVNNFEEIIGLLFPGLVMEKSLIDLQ
ncbi:MAG TPA: HAD family hydrolase [Edaphocola sp.]|nr:HAD family hydrolase [Edaphocola sp.]